MASIVKEPNGRRRIEVFVGGKRRKVRLGKVPQKVAENYKARLDALATAVDHDLLPDRETSEWLAAREPVMRERIENAGLVPHAMRKPLRTLGEFLDEYFKHLKVKPGTLTMLGQTRDNLIAHFGRDKSVSQIGPLDADRFAQWLHDQPESRRNKRKGEEASKLADATVSRRVRVARQMFKMAVTWEVIRRNPFGHVKSSGEVNESRLFFVTREMTDKLMEATADVQWRVIIALSRYAGMRCPSEHLALRWDDINFGAKKMTVRSAKTEHHKGKALRVIPLFPEVEAVLLEARDQAAEGEPFVITRYRDPKQNLRTTFLKIIDRASLLPWPRLFQNLRSSRETELVETFPIQVATAWIGNSEKIARKHYLQVTEDHYRQAVAAEAQSAAQCTASSTEQHRATTMSNSQNPNETALPGGGEGVQLSPAGSVSYDYSPEKDPRFLTRGAYSGARQERDKLPDERRMAMALRVIRAQFRAMAKAARRKAVRS